MELRKLLDEKGMNYTATDSGEMDITNQTAVDAFFQKVNPTLVFHCAAYTAVDKAEDEGKDLNEKVNAIGTKIVAEAAEANGAVMVYISTDYVFDGNNSKEYTETDQANPQNEYGRMKYEVEQWVRSLCSKFYIIRTSWVFGEFGNNFVCTMLRLGKTHPILTVVDDQFGRPTWTRTLAAFMLHLLDTNAAYGVYHLSNDGSCSWYEFAREILKNHNVEVKPVTSAEYPQKAYRPKHSIMDLSKAKATGFQIPTWEEALSQFVASIDA